MTTNKITLKLDKADVSYYPDYINYDNKTVIYNNIVKMFQIDSTYKNVILQDKIYKLNRKTIVFIDKKIDKTIIPKIWGNNVQVIEFPDYLIKLKESIEKDTDFKFNICLANYYQNGKRNIGYHSDNEEKGSISCIASISLGSERTFAFRNKGTIDDCYKLILKDASLLIMGNGCQENYEHSLLVDKLCKDPRLNLTFRLFDEERYKT